MCRQLAASLILTFFVAYAAAINGDCVSFKNNAFNEKFNLVYDWTYINFTWPSPKTYETAVSSGSYIPEHNAVVGVKYYNEKFYLALPKIKSGAPVTLARVNQYPDNNIHTNPLLTPYPSWKMNTDSACNNLQNIQSMEIDRKGVMWILDGNKDDIHSHFNNKCPPKIILLDLNSGGRTVKSYTIPNEISKHDNCFLNDIVLDEIDGGYAYITDTSSDPGLIVYSRKLNRAWKVKDTSMFAQPEALNFTVHGHTHYHPTPIDGIAMAPPNSLDDPNRLVYYSALAGLNLYAINSSVLRNEKLAKSPKIKDYIIDFGKKIGQSDGMMMDSEGDLYYGVLTQDSIAKWNSKAPISTSEIIDKNSDLIVWPDSFGFDPFGNLYLIANNIDYFISNPISTNNTNFRLLKLYTGTCSYQY